MTLSHMKKCSTFASVREMSIKSTLRCLTTSPLVEAVVSHFYALLMEMKKWYKPQGKEFDNKHSHTFTL